MIIFIIVNCYHHYEVKFVTHFRNEEFHELGIYEYIYLSDRSLWRPFQLLIGLALVCSQINNIANLLGDLLCTLRARECTIDVNVINSGG